jgi:hypothetical protein
MTTQRLAVGFRVLGLARRVAGWEIVVRCGGRRYRRWWVEEDCPSRRKVRSDFQTRPAFWVEVG